MGKTGLVGGIGDMRAMLKERYGKDKSSSFTTPSFL